MSFLAPLFLAGALAVGLPVIFHLIRRTTRERTPFSSLMFLSPSPPRLTRRSRLEHLLLLALRCLVLVLLAVGFARPFLRKPMASNEPQAGSRRIALLLDTSASMRRAGLWPAGVAKANSTVASARPGDQVAVYTFDRQLHPLITFDQWNQTPVSERVAIVSQKLAQTSPGWSGTWLGEALIAAAETLADTVAKGGSRPGEIVVISDLQEGSRPEQLQGYDWPKGVTLDFEPLKARRSSNASLQLVTESDRPESSQPSEIRLRVSNSADSRREQFKVGWAPPNGREFAGTPVEIYVPAGQSRIVTLAENQQHNSRVLLQGDDDDFDNEVFVATAERTQANVIYFGADQPNDAHRPLYFVERAFQGTRQREVRVSIASPEKPLPPGQLQSATLLISAGGLTAPEASAIAQLVKAGKILLFALRGEGDGAALGEILGARNLNVTEARPSRYAMLAEIDFRHPLFSAFADPRFSDFTRIHFWRYRVLNPAELPPSARILAKFDDGTPAVIEAPVERGRVLIVASTWQPADSQLALSTKFVPLLYSLLEQSSGPPPAPTQYYVGDSIPIGLQAAQNNAGVQVTTPDGSQLKLSPSDTNFSATMSRGIYTVSSSAATNLARFAVNMDPLESRTAPVPLDEFERMGVPVAAHVSSLVETARKAQLQNTELENRQKLWRWILVGTILVLLSETWLAGRTARKVAVEGGAA